MRHAQHNLLQTELPAALHDLLNRGDQDLSAIHAKALRARVFLMEEALKHFALNQALEDRFFALGRKIGVVVAGFHPRLHPLLFIRIRQMRELHADGPAIGLSQGAHDVS